MDKLDSILIPELKCIHNGIRELDKNTDEEEKKQRREQIIQRFEMLFGFSRIAREEGLLGLEDVANKLNENNNAIAKEMLLLIVDGTDPEYVGRLALMRYFSSQFDSYQALVAVAEIYALIGIQAGEHPILLKETMQSLMQDESESIERLYQKIFREKSPKKVDTDLFYAGGLRVEEGRKGYLEIMLCDRILQSMDCRTIQRVLVELSDYTISGILNGLSGEARKTVIHNMPKRNAKRVLQNVRDDFPEGDKRYFIENTGELENVRKTALILLQMIDRLNCRGEIVLSIEPEDRFLSVLLRQIERDDNEREKRKRDWDRLIWMIKCDQMHV